MVCSTPMQGKVGDLPRKNQGCFLQTTTNYKHKSWGLHSCTYPPCWCLLSTRRSSSAPSIKRRLFAAIANQLYTALLTLYGSIKLRLLQGHHTYRGCKWGFLTIPVASSHWSATPQLSHWLYTCLKDTLSGSSRMINGCALHLNVLYVLGVARETCAQRVGNSKDYRIRLNIGPEHCINLCLDCNYIREYLKEDNVGAQALLTLNDDCRQTIVI